MLGKLPPKVDYPLLRSHRCSLRIALDHNWSQSTERDSSMRSKLLAGAGATIAATAALAGSAYAGTGSVSPGTFAISTTAAGTVTTNVTWSGFNNSLTKYVYVCNDTDANPLFDYASNCETLSELPDETPNGSTLAYTFPVYDVDAVNSPWLCAAPGSAVKSLGGVNYTNYSTCYIRVTQGTPGNLTEDFFAPITFTASGTSVVPQFPTSTVALAAIGSIAAVAAGAFMLRSRRSTLA
jgi:hypothetical protein